jgi:hypothetical protein
MNTDGISMNQTLVADYVGRLKKLSDNIDYSLDECIKSLNKLNNSISETHSHDLLVAYSTDKKKLNDFTNKLRNLAINLEKRIEIVNRIQKLSDLRK